MAGKFSSPRKTVATILAVLILVGPALMAGPSQAQVQAITCPTGFDVGVPIIPPFALASLKTVPNPVFPPDEITLEPALRADLAEYIANPTAAIQLGKALFWDMQAGSDSKAGSPPSGTACATCHYHAGADARTKNQLNPGPDGSWDAGYSANYLVASGDFPFPILPNTDKIAGSQGVRKSTFQSISKSGAELTTTPTGFRQVTGKNTPSTINAVFNHRQFWNGRAQPDFNGVNPFGSRDTSARVWVLDYRGFPVQVAISIKDASPASQAVGPALNEVEMSAKGRTFPELGKKLLLLKPLGLQKVDPTDSVLGGIADPTKGLTVSYKTLIQQAFQPKWWKTSKSVSVGGKSYTMMQANFSLYWGLSIMLYAATQVSDDTPMDQYLATRLFDPLTGALIAEGDLALMNQVAANLQTDYGYTGGAAGILNGLHLFEQPLPPFGTGRECIACHLGPNLTSASVQNLVGHGLEPADAAFRAAGFNGKMERMFMQIPPVPTDLLNLNPTFFTTDIEFDPSTYAVTVTGIQDVPVPPFSVPGPARVAVYDAGWYNIGIRPTGDDQGLNDTDPFGNNLSWTRLYQALPDPSFIKVPGGGLACAVPPGADPIANPLFPFEVLNASGFPLLSGPLLKTEPTDVAGTFKTSALRNVELNGPYFHNGGKSTLKQVVGFYDRGGDFANDTQSPLVKFLGFLSANGFGMTPNEVNDLVAFLLALTDERVRLQSAPFDHPQLFVPNGAVDGSPGTDNMEEIPPVGAGGGATLQRFLDLNPFSP